jgi:AraC-like DNA-binding protein
MISEVIGSVRIGRAQARTIQESGAWGMRFSAFEGSGFHLILRGDGWLIPATGEARRLSVGDVIFAPGGREHGLSHRLCTLDDLPPAIMGPGGPATEPADIEFLCGAYRLDHGQVHHYLRALPDVLAVSPDYDRNPELRIVADLLLADLADARPGTETTRPALLDLMLTHVLRQWLEQNRSDWPQISDPAITAALREIHASPDKPWTVQQLSQTAGLSRTAFSKRFTALVGQPPMTYVTGWRLSYGARLLRETSAPLATVARQVGYSTEFAFGGAFRRAYGVSPGRFRNPAPAPGPAATRHSPARLHQAPAVQPK